MLMCFLVIPFCQAGVGFDNFKCLNCPGEVRVPTGYVMFNGGTGWESFGMLSIMGNRQLNIFEKKINKCS